MKFRKIKIASLAVVLLSAGHVPVHSQVVISEVDPSGSAKIYNADWFELTNLGSAAVNLTGWKMDDNSNSFGASVALRGITSLAAGQSAIFLESTDSLPATDLAVQTSFKTAWFGSSAPAGLLLGNYNGSGVGMSQTGDAVNIFNSSGLLISKVTFGEALGNATFDNTARLSNVTLSTFSLVGVNGAFLAPNGEVGSPGIIPEPSTYAVIAGGLILGFVLLRRKGESVATLS